MEEKGKELRKYSVIWIALATCLLLLAGCSSQSSKSSSQPTPLDIAFSSGKPTVAEFGRGTCIPCKEMKPILDNLAMVYKDKLNVLIISVDEYRSLTNQQGIMAIPTQIFFDSSGKEVTRHIGFFAREDIIAQLNKMGIE